jgi:hypothetical protein
MSSSLDTLSEPSGRAACMIAALRALEPNRANSLKARIWRACVRGRSYLRSHPRGSEPLDGLDQGHRRMISHRLQHDFAFPRGQFGEQRLVAPFHELAAIGMICHRSNMGILSRQRQRYQDRNERDESQRRVHPRLH